MIDSVVTDGASGDGTPSRWRRLEEWHLLAALLAGVVVARSIGDFLGDFVPMSDVAIFEARAYDVFSRHPPLVGMLSTASDAADPLYHPGPILFWLMAIPVRLADHGRGLAIGMGVFNAGCLVASVAAARQFFGRSETAVVAVVLAVLVWSLGPNVFHDAWLPHASIAPFFLLLICSWGVASGRDSLAPWLAVAWSLTGQIHGSTFVVGSTIAAAAVGARWLGPQRAPARTRPWKVAGLIAVVLWLPPVAQQVAGSGRGNLLALAGGGERGHGTLGFEAAVRIAGSTLVAPPWWLRPGVEDQLPQLGGRPAEVGSWSTSASLVAIAALVALVGLIFDWSLRRRDRPVAAGAAVSLVGIVGGIVFSTRIPNAPIFGFQAHTVRWLWPLGAFVCAVLLVAAARWISLSTAVVRPVLAGAGLATTVAVSMAPELNIGPTANWRMFAGSILEVRRAVGRWTPDGTVYVRLAPPDVIDPLSDAVVAELVSNGVFVLVDHPFLERQLDVRHTYRGEADWDLYRTTEAVHEDDGLLIIVGASPTGPIGEAGSSADSPSLIVAARRD